MTTKTALVLAFVLATALVQSPAGAQSGTLRVTPSSGPRGSVLTISSVTPCSLPQGVSGSPLARVVLRQGATVIATKDFHVSTSGAWSGSLIVGSAANPGASVVGGDCIASPHAEGALVHYQDVGFTVTTGPPTSTSTSTTSSSTTTTTAPTSGGSSNDAWLWALVAVLVLAVLLVIVGVRRRRSRSTRT